MALFQQISDIPDSEIFIWKVDEDDAYYLEKVLWDKLQLEWLNTIHPVKRREYLASRFLIFHTVGLLDSHLFKDEAGKIYLKNKKQHISISHSSNYCGVAISKKNIGFDLQIYKEKVIRVSKRFLSLQESMLLGSHVSMQELTKTWTIKEAVYKAYGQKGIQFNKQILMNIDQKEPSCQILNAKLVDKLIEVNYEIYSQSHAEFCWTLAIEN